MVEYILVVDDQKLMRLLLQEILREAGYVAKCVKNGWECLKIARSSDKPALILLDHKMPQLTGLEALMMLKKDKITEEIPVIMITGTDDIANKAKSIGAHMVLPKPLDNNNLIKTVRQIMSNNLKAEGGTV